MFNFKVKMSFVKKMWTQGEITVNCMDIVVPVNVESALFPHHFKEITLTQHGLYIELTSVSSGVLVFESSYKTVL